MSKTCLALAATALVFSPLTVSPAHAAGVSRAWVSGHGTDAAGCGAPTNPCRSLQYVHDSIIAAGGEIDILDPAGYGAIAITKAISIVNDGVGVAGVQQTTTGDAISITALSTDAITLRGLTIDGLGVAQDGIGLEEAGKLTVINCVIRHFVHDGLYVQQGSGALALSVLGTTAADNTSNGFDISPSGHGEVLGLIDHSDALNNGANGVVVWGLNTVVATNRTYVTVSNSNLANNGPGNNGDGVYSKGQNNTIVIVRNDVSDYNDNGYYVDAGSSMYFSRTEALNDVGDGIHINGGGIGKTFGDNVFVGLTGTLTPVAPG